MKTNLDSMFKTSEEFETKGIWFDINETTGFLVRRFGGFNSQKVKASLAKYMKPYAYQIEKKTLEDSKSVEIMARVFVESSVIDWRGVVIDGEAKDFSPDLAVALFVKLPELFDTLHKYASDSSNYREELGN